MSRVETNKDLEKVRIFLIRHGRTGHNTKKIMQGQTDVEMGDEGLRQTTKIGQKFKDITFDFIVTSDLKRCTRTKDEILSHHPDFPQDRARSTPALRERDMGEVEGMPMLEAINKFGFYFDGVGEKREDMVARVDSEWNKVINEAKENDYLNVVCCTHGGVITAFTNHLCDNRGYVTGNSLLRASLKVPVNVSVTVIDYNKSTDEGVIEVFGNDRHLYNY